MGNVADVQQEIPECRSLRDVNEKHLYPRSEENLVVRSAGHPGTDYKYHLVQALRPRIAHGEHIRKNGIRPIGAARGVQDVFKSRGAVYRDPEAAIAVV